MKIDNLNISALSINTEGGAIFSGCTFYGNQSRPHFSSSDTTDAIVVDEREEALKRYSIISDILMQLHEEHLFREQYQWNVVAHVLNRLGLYEGELSFAPFRRFVSEYIRQDVLRAVPLTDASFKKTEQSLYGDRPISQRQAESFESQKQFDKMSEMERRFTSLIKTNGMV